MIHNFMIIISIQSRGMCLRGSQYRWVIVAAEAIRSPQFITLLLANFFCCATHSGPIFHTVSYAISCGIPLITAVSIYRTIIGGTAMAGSLGMATGPLAGGLIYDTFASYGWLYIGAWGTGIGAFLIALTFRPYAAKPKPEPARAASQLNGRPG
jgi:MFS family permease